MQMIAELGIEEQDKKKTARTGDKPMPEREDGDDNFGMADEDWDIYREIQKDGFSEDEEDD